MTRAERNAAALAKLNPTFAKRVGLWLQACDARFLAPCIIQGMRTMQEQAALYAQGRTAPGKIVTNAPAGSSYHNYGLAVDVVDFGASGEKDKYEASDFDHSDYTHAMTLALPFGLEWGGAWRTFKDLPHFEWHPGYGPRDARKLAAFADEDGNLPANFFAEDYGSDEA